MPDPGIDILKRTRERLVAVLQDAGASVNGTGAVRCPFHDDAHASGSIHQGTDGGGWIYTCHGCTWNGDKSSGDVLDVVRRVHGVDFRGACELLGLNGTAGNPRSGERKPPENRRGDGGACPSTPPNETGAVGLADAAHVALMGNPAALAHLWRTRAVDRATAERFGLGITGAPGSRFWTFPIADADGNVVACKCHRADGQEQKSWWTPKGTRSDRVWPVNLEPTGPVWVEPGELKSLAVASLGLATFGVTAGEGSVKAPRGLPEHAVKLLTGRQVAIVADDDETGRAWGEHVRQQLADAGIECRVVDLGLDKTAGLKDVGDFITRRLVEDAKEPAAVAATLAHAYELADPWHGTTVGSRWADPRTWRPATYVSTGLSELDKALHGGLRTGGVHVLGGKSGHCKSQFAVTIAVNAARRDFRVGFFSLELSAADVAQLAAAQLGGIPRRVLAGGQVTGEYGERLRRVREQFGDIPLTLLDDAHWPNGLDRDGLARLVGDGVRRFGWRLVVVDYLGLLAPSETDRDQYTTDLRNSTVLRRLAREHDLALVVVAALRKSAMFKPKASKNGTPAKPAPPNIDDLLGAGRLAYDAQSVLLVTRENGDADTGLVNVQLLKVRFAPTLDEPLSFRWHPKTGAIVDLMDEETCREVERAYGGLREE